MMLKIIMMMLLVAIMVYMLYTVYHQTRKETFSSNYLVNMKNNLDEDTKENFVSGTCPTTLVKKGNQILLYNPNMVKVPGVNPIVLKSLKEYEKYVKWQRANNLDCPILHLERMYDSQGHENYEIKNSFMLNEPSGPLNHDLPVVHKTPNVGELLNAHYDNNKPYNKFSYPAYDPYNQNLGVMTKLDLDGPNPNLSKNTP